MLSIPQIAREEDRDFWQRTQRRRPMSRPTRIAIQAAALALGTVVVFGAQFVIACWALDGMQIEVARVVSRDERVAAEVGR